MTSSHQKIGDKEASTRSSDGKAYPAPARVEFDNECAPCRTLAQFMSKSVPRNELVFVPSTEQAPETLVVRLNDGEVLRAAQAWEWLLVHHPSLSLLNGFAAKVGLTREVAAVLGSGAGVLRRLCPGCHRRGVYGSRR